MEKQKQAVETEETLSTAMEEDRISQLPIPIRHHILCFLSQKEAVRTCLLSKQWRHIGTTRPNLDFSQEWFDDTSCANCSSILRRILYHLRRPWRHRGSTRRNLNSSEKLFNTTQQSFVSVVNRTLQAYLDQNLSIQKLHLDLSRPASPPVKSLLGKWIPMIPALNVKSFIVNFRSYTLPCYCSPSTMFIAESLEVLHVRNFRLSPVKRVWFKSLRTLTLEKVHFGGDTLDTRMLGCPLLSRLVIKYCWKLRNVRLGEAPGLKHFELCDYMKMEGRSIEIDAPNLETVSLSGPWIWCHRESTLLFSRLTSLDLYSVILSSESFDLLSFGCPTLASLTLYNCSGFEEFHLASDSVKYLNISTSKIPLKEAMICAPNILRFTFTARIPKVPDKFTFTTTTSKEWDSYIFLSSCEEDPEFDVNWWFLGLRRMLKALSGSRISLYLQIDGGPRGVPCSSTFLGDEPPLVVRYMKFTTCKCHTASWYLEFMNGLFCVCRPSRVWGGNLVRGSDRSYRLSEFQLNMLLAYKNIRTEPYFWLHDLEKVHIDGELVQWTDLSELRNRTYDGKIWLYLNWRGHTTA